jgi:hypothetical protein
MHVQYVPLQSLHPLSKEVTVETQKTLNTPASYTMYNQDFQEECSQANTDLIQIPM